MKSTIDRAKAECVDDKNVLAPVRKRLKLEARLNGQKAPKGYTVEDWGKPVGREVQLYEEVVHGKR